MRESLAPYAVREPRSSASTKLSVSLPTDLVEVVRATALESGMTVSATIAASLRQTLMTAEQESLDRALSLDAEEDREWAAVTADVHARLVSELEW